MPRKHAPESGAGRCDPARGGSIPERGAGRSGQVVDCAKEGDQIEIRIADVRTFEVQRDRSRQDALDKLRKLRRPLPSGFVFDRDDANAR